MNRRKLTGRMCECRGCGEYFNSEAAFNKHRIGTHGENRRCMTIQEMCVAGMVKNARDLWIGEPMPERVRV